MSLRTVLRVGIAALPLPVAGALLAAVPKAFGAPAQWTGSNGAAWVKLFDDGQKAAGDVRATLPQLYVEMELSGAHSAGRCTGTLQGTARKGDQTMPLTGKWEADLAGSPLLRLTVQPRNGQPRTISVPLTHDDVFKVFRCSWARGTVTRTRRGSSAALQANDVIQVGDVIQTGAQSGAIVVLGDSSVVMMQERSRITIPDVPENRDGRAQKVAANQGKVWFAVRKVQERARFEVETDEAIAAVRGTEFLVEVDPDADTSITTAEGEVDVRDATGEDGAQAAVPVTEGMSWRMPRPRKFSGVAFQRQTTRLAAGQLAEITGRWQPMLDQADRVWPFRRERKARFWQNHLHAAHPGAREHSGPGGGAGPAAGPRERRAPGAGPMGPGRRPSGSGRPGRPGGMGRRRRFSSSASAAGGASLAVSTSPAPAAPAMAASGAAVGAGFSRGARRSPQAGLPGPGAGFRRPRRPVRP